MTKNEAPGTSSDTGEREGLIRDLAYQLWESEGRPEGREEEYWRRAKERLAAEGESSYPPTQSRSDRT